MSSKQEREWAERLGAHLVKRSYSEPHWDAQRGAVMAFERVTLYGLPIVDGRKVASIGLRIRRGCSYHGLAFNVAMDLEPFRRINPCGFRGLEVTDLRVEFRSGREIVRAVNGVTFSVRLRQRS